ncbi:MAG: hypothetical protein ACLQHF_12470 [Terracidiphilus sp.]
MTSSRKPFSLVASVLLWTCCSNAVAQKAGVSSPSGEQQVLSLDFTNSGDRLAARVGQQIEIKLGAVGACEPCEPQISSPAIRFEDVALPWPVNPGITGQIYLFEAVAQGEAQVRVPINDFAVTIQVKPTDGGPSTPYASRTPDQANSAPWDNAWTNLNDNFLRQAFTPSLPRLTAVEVELEVANPGPASSVVTMYLENPRGKVLVALLKAVPVDNCHHVLFVFPEGGLRVSPGQVYSIRVSGGDGLFGWRYVVGGYPNGSASFNGKPLLHDARSSFLFRTLGAR